MAIEKLMLALIAALAANTKALGGKKAAAAKDDDDDATDDDSTDDDDDATDDDDSTDDDDATDDDATDDDEDDAKKEAKAKVLKALASLKKAAGAKGKLELIKIFKKFEVKNFPSSTPKQWPGMLKAAKAALVKYEGG